MVGVDKITKTRTVSVDDDGNYTTRRTPFSRMCFCFAKRRIYQRMLSLNTSSDDTLDDEDLVPIHHPACRQDLYIARTKLCDKNGKRLNFLGVFTAKPLKPGDFVGFYTGEWWEENAYERRANLAKLNEYALNTSSELVISPPIEEGESRPDPTKHPMSICNEPPLHLRANAFLTEYKFNIDEIDIDADKVDPSRWDDDFPAAGILMCTALGAHKEIVWSYGGTRPYAHGKSCKPPKKQVWKNPFNVLGSIPPCAVPIRIRTRAKKRKRS